MSDHNKPQSTALVQALKDHRLPHDKPSQLADSFRHGWLAALRTPVPAGWKLVPIEPTDAMAVAALNVSLNNPAINGVSQWAAMLAAAPTPPAPARVDELLSALKELRHAFRPSEEPYDPVWYPDIAKADAVIAKFEG